jgi:peptide/nickel transport system substrate-binding protein
MNRLRILVVASAALLALAACSSSSGGSAAGTGASAGTAAAAPAGSAQPGGTLKVARAESFDGWNPDSAAAYASYQTLNAVLEPLVRVSADGSGLEPGIASKWTYDPKAMTWTFTLRDGVTFSDGTPLTSADVAFSAGEWAKGKNFGYAYANIKNVKAPDPLTVVFELAAPDSTLPVLMSWTSSAVYPKDFGGKAAKDFYNAPVGAGAFTVADWTPGGRIDLKKSAHYYLPGRPYLDGVQIDVVADANEESLLFESGQADIVEYVSAVNAPKYADAIVALPESQVEHLSLNVKKPALADPSVRKAIALGIDYAAIAKGAFPGHGTPAKGIIAPNLPNWAAPTVAPVARDVAAAKAELAKAATQPGTLELIYDSGIPADGLVAQVVQSNLKDVGIDVKLTGLETGAFLDRAFGLDSDMMVWSYGAISPDVVDPMGWILGTSMLFTGADDAKLAQQMADYRAAETPEAKQKIVAQVQDDAAADGSAIPLADFQVLHAAGKNVNGFSSAPWGLYYWDPIWLAR